MTIRNAGGGAWPHPVRATQATGIEVLCRHGINHGTMNRAATMASARDLNIGQFLIGEPVFHGPGPAIAEMRSLMEDARPAT